MSILKISFEGTVKRVKLSAEVVTELKETAARLFPQLAGSEFFVKVEAYRNAPSAESERIERVKPPKEVRQLCKRLKRVEKLKPEKRAAVEEEAGKKLAEYPNLYAEYPKLRRIVLEWKKSKTELTPDEEAELKALPERVKNDRRCRSARSHSRKSMRRHSMPPMRMMAMMPPMMRPRRMGPGMMGPRMGRRMGPGMGRRMGPGMGPRMGPGMGPRMGPGMGPRMCGRMGPPMCAMGPRMGRRMGRRGMRRGMSMDPRMAMMRMGGNPRRMMRMMRKGRPMRGMKGGKCKYPMIKKQLKRVLKGKGEMNEQAKKRLIEILTKDPQAFQKRPRLRLTALQIKKTLTELIPAEVEELTTLEKKVSEMPRRRNPRSCSPRMNRRMMRNRSGSRRDRSASRKERSGSRRRMMGGCPRRRMMMMLMGGGPRRGMMMEGRPHRQMRPRVFECDGCKMKPITGVRHACRRCNFDLCENCVKNQKHEHPLKVIDAPVRHERRCRRQASQPKVVAAKPVETKPKETPGAEKKVKFEAVDESEVAESAVPSWVVAKGKQLVEILGANQEKAEVYVAANKFLSIDELIDMLLANPAELAKLQ